MSPGKADGKTEENTERKAEGDVRSETAEVLLETMPSVMGFVSSELRRSSPVSDPVHFRLLRTLRRGSRSLHELAELQAVRLPTMSRTVSVLENRGWVERTRSNEDRRTVYAHITDAGRDALAEVERMAIERVSSLLECLSEEDLERLRSGLGTLYEVIQEHVGQDPAPGAPHPEAPGCSDEREEG